MSTSEIAKLESRWRENPNGLTFTPLAEAYRKQKDPRRALEILAPGLEKHPDYIPANIVLGRCHCDLNDLPAAEKAFTHVLELDGENVIVLKALADMAEGSVRYGEAERWLETLLVADPSNDDAREQLARVRARQREQAEAASAAEPVEDSRWAPPAEPVTGAEPAEGGSVQGEPAEAEPARAHEMLAGLSPSWGQPGGFEPSPPEAGPREPKALDPEPPMAVEAGSAGYFGWVPRPNDHADDFADEGESIPLESPSSAGSPPMPDPDSFDFGQLEQTEDIVLNVSGSHSEFQTPSAAEDLMDNVLGTPRTSIDDLRRDLAPPEPITSALSSFASPFASRPELPEAPEPDPPAGEEPKHFAPTRTAEFFALDEPPAPPPDPPAADLDDAPGVAEPDLVVTETMAEVFLKQGHVGDALAVYRELARRNPSDTGLGRRVAELETRRSAVDPTARRAYAASVTGGQSVTAWFQALLAARPAPLPDQPASPPAQAEPDAASATRPAGDPLTLGSVFGEDAPPVTPAVRGSGTEAKPSPGSTTVSFDDFFGSASGTGGPASGPAAGRPPRSAADADLDQFQAWLQSLKR